MISTAWVGYSIAALLGVLALWFIALNGWALWVGVTREEHHSPLPFVGGIFGAIAMGLSPWEVLHGWAWVPLVVDPGCAFVLVMFVWSAVATRVFRD